MTAATRAYNRLLVCGCPSGFVRDNGHQEGCDKYGEMRCLTCGGKRGVWADDLTGETWTCFRCGDEWPQS